MRRSDFLPPIPPRFVILRLAVPRVACCSLLPKARQRPIRSAGRFEVRHPHAFFRRGDDRISQVPGESLVFVPCSWTPVRPMRQVVWALRCCLPHHLRRRLSQDAQFRGSMTRPVHSLCTLRSAGYPSPTQHSVPAGDQPLPGRVMLPAGLRIGFTITLCHCFLRSRLGLAQKRWTL